MFIIFINSIKMNIIKINKLKYSVNKLIIMYKMIFNKN